MNNTMNMLVFVNLFSSIFNGWSAVLNFTGKRSTLNFGVRFLRFKLQSGPKVENGLFSLIIVNHPLAGPQVTLRVEVGGDVV